MYLKKYKLTGLKDQNSAILLHKLEMNESKHISAAYLNCCSLRPKDIKMNNSAQHSV